MAQLGAGPQSWVIARSGQPRAGIDMIRDTLAELRRIGQEFHRPWLLYLLAEAYAAGSEFERAMTQIVAIQPTAPVRVGRRHRRAAVRAPHQPPERRRRPGARLVAPALRVRGQNLMDTIPGRAVDDRLVLARIRLKLSVQSAAAALGDDACDRRASGVLDAGLPGCLCLSSACDYASDRIDGAQARCNPGCRRRRL